MRSGRSGPVERRQARMAGVAGVIGLALGLAMCADALATWAAARSLEAYAIHLARTWTERAAEAGARPPALGTETEHAEVARGARSARNVLAHDFYDATGAPLTAAPAGPAATEALPRSRPRIWSRLQAGEAAIRLLPDPRPSRGSALTEAEVFLPMGEARAPGTLYARVRLDLSEVAAATMPVLLGAGLGLAALAGAAFLAPALAWLALRTRADAARAEVHTAAHADLLTGLLNRAGFAAAAAEACLRARGPGERLAAVSIDLDRFRALNDQFGAAAGDDVLRHAARILRACLRRGDALARLGGDEFGVLVRLRRGEELGPILRGLARRLSGPVPAGGGLAEVTASLGGCLLSHDGDDVTAALRRAEIARAEARASGGGRARVFEPEMEERLRQGRRLERCIREAMDEGRVHLVYQPLVSGDGHRLRGFEALMRLTDADGCTVAPAEFIPVAEASGDIVALGAWALREAASTAARWSAPLRVSVNLSAVQFRDGGLVETVGLALREAGLPARRMELEVTESLLAADPDEAERQLTQLQRMGVSVAMDDFGAGYSSLANLWRFRFDRLKLDRRFAEALEAAPARASDMIAAMVALGHRLDMRVTAEGVETPAQAQVLARLGCDDLQGFLFGRPAQERELPLLIDAAEERASAAACAAALGARGAPAAG